MALAGAALWVAACATEAPSTSQNEQAEQVGSVQSAYTYTVTNGFYHPGVVNSWKTLDFVANQISLGVNPWKAAFNIAAADTYGQTTYVDHPPTDSGGAVQCGSHSSPDVHCHDQRNDALAAYTQALLWYLAPSDSRAATWGANATKYLNDWASSLTAIQNSNMVVQAAWVGGLFASAAEILRYGRSSGGGAESHFTSTVVTNIDNMFKNVFVPLLCPSGLSSCVSTNGSIGKNGNWVTSTANSLIQIGAYRSDAATFNAGVALWNDRTPTYSYLKTDGSSPKVPTGGYSGSGSGKCGSTTPDSALNPPNGCDAYGYWGQAGNLVDGVCQETCRDFEHAQMGLDAIFVGALTAGMQYEASNGAIGQDLFKSQATRLTAALEFEAKYLNEATPGTTANNFTSSPLDSWLCMGGQFGLTQSTNVSSPMPAYEIAYNEYVNREGLSLPHTNQLINNNRNQAWWTYDMTRQVAWETLTHAGVGDPWLSNCTPTTCSAQGKNCGTIPDGCGGTLSCGTCSGSNTCGGGGVANVCGTSCVPNTCQYKNGNSSTPWLAPDPGTGTAIVKNCGQISDGCGGFLNCGTCAAPSGSPPTNNFDCGGQANASNQLGYLNVCGPDLILPTGPTAVDAPSVAATSVTLSWSGASDDYAVASYNVYRGGTSIATGVTATHYTDTTVSAGHSGYSYKVCAVDEAGNVALSSGCATITVNTPAACTPVTCASGPYCGQTADGCGGTIACSTTCGTGVCGGGVTVLAPTKCADRFDTTTSSSCTNLNSCQADVTAPAFPTGGSNLAAPSATLLSNSVTLTWTAANDNVAVTGYNIFRGGTNIGTSTTTSYTDTTVSANTTYTYQVQAYDAAGKTSAQDPATPITVKTPCAAASCGTSNCGTITDSCSGTTLFCGTCSGANYCGGSGTANSCAVDNQAPDAPTSITEDTTQKTTSTVAFSWTAPADNPKPTNSPQNDNEVGSGVVSYQVFRNGTQVGTPGSPYFKDTGLQNNTQYSYTVKAVDKSGNPSVASSAALISTKNATPVALNEAGWVATGSQHCIAPPSAIGQGTASHYSAGVTQANGIWLLVDMLQQRAFTKVTMDDTGWSGDCPGNFVLQGSNDNVNFTQFYPSSGSAHGTDGVTTASSFGNQSYRYIRVMLTGGGNGACTGWWAIKKGGLIVYN